MKIKILKPLSGLDFSYIKGQEIEVEDKRGKEWIEAGMAKEVKNEKKSTSKTKTSTKSTTG